MENVELQSYSGGRKPNRIIIAIAGVLLAFFFILVISFSSSSTASSQTSSTLIPSKFYVNNSYLIPAADQGVRSDSWIFSAIGLLESQYRNQGISAGYLSSSDYLPLSEESLLNWMSLQCTSNPTVYPCPKNPLTIGLPNGTPETFISFIKAFPSVKKSILPASSCIYSTSATSIQNCTNLKADISSNPLEFSVSSVNFTNGIDSVKSLLFLSKRPLIFTSPAIGNRFWFNSSIVGGEFYKNNSLDYALFDFFPSRSYSTPFTLSGDLAIGEPHSMLLVGYDDSLTPVSQVSNSSSKGAFIFRNSWGPSGHSIGFFQSKISFAQESALCPNADDVSSWVPVSISCINNTKNPSQCSSDLFYYSRDSSENMVRFNGGRELKCTDGNHCDTSMRYALLRAMGGPRIVYSEYGVPLATMVEWNDSYISAVLIDTLPYPELYRAFQLVDKKENSEKECGYFALSYDTIEKMEEKLTPESYPWTVYNLEVKWTDSSYVAHGGGKDYSKVKSSMVNFTILEEGDPYKAMNISDYL